MSRQKKICLVIAALLVLIGSIAFVSVMTMLEWDFSKLSTIKYESNEYRINENFKNISIVTNTADIVFLPCETNESLIQCFEQQNVKHSVTVNGDTLIIEVVDTRKWYEHIGINFKTPKITISIPQGEYGTLLAKSDTGDTEIPNAFKFEIIDICESTGDVKNSASASGDIRIKTSTGNICVENISAGALNLSVSTGDITVFDAVCENDLTVEISTGRTTLTDIMCKSVISSGDTGDLYLKNVIATEKYSIERSTGDVKLDGSDAGEIFINTDTGDVTGTLLSEKIFMTETSTGKVTVPKTTSGGKCDITTSTGNINISVK